MKITPRQRKWLKILAVLLLIRFVVGGLLYYVVVYRFKEIVQIAVASESNGLYTFDAGKIDVSLFKKNLSLTNASLICNDSSQDKSYYQVKVPGIYLSINSFSDLLFRKKFSVDSIALNSPEITAHMRQKNDTAQLSFQTSKIVEAVQQTLQHLEIRALHMHDASFNYFSRHAALPFRGTHIDLNVSNFSKKEKRHDYLFSADDVDLLIRNQDWQLPDGRHRVAFSRLHFSGKDQRFELDSCFFSSAQPGKENMLELVADQIFFKSRHLQNIYQKEELEIDTISFVRPVLSIQSAKLKNKDSSAAINDGMSSLFKKISLKYIDIKDGQFSYGAGANSNQNYQTERTNLQLFNLSMLPGVRRGLRIDSVNLKLNRIVFITKDSLNQLEIGEFKFSRNHVSLMNANYGPTVKNLNPNALDFSTNLLELEDVSLEELIRKRLVGTVARLHMPVIHLKSNNKKKEEVNASRTIREIFRTLHSLQELIEVDSFKIMQGKLNYKSRVDELTVDLNGLNSTILINRLLKSDSLVDIKRSLLDFSVDAIKVNGPSLALKVQHYRFSGGFANNLLSAFTLNTKSGSIKGSNISWKGFDWDLFANRKIVQMQALSAESISADLAKSGQQDNTAELPQINIANLQLNRVSLFYKPAADKQLRFTGRSVFINKIASSGHHFTWNNFRGDFSALKYLLPGTSLQAAGAKLNSAGTHEIRNLELSTGGPVNAFIPLISLQVAPRSSDISRLSIPFLTMEDARVKINADAATKKRSPFTLQMDLFVSRFQSKRTMLEYSNAENEMTAKAIVEVEVNNLGSNTSGESIFTYGSSGISIIGANVERPSFKADLPTADILIHPGSIRKAGSPSIKASLKFSNGSFSMSTLDSSQILLSGITGELKDHEYKPGLNWQELLPVFNLKNANATYHTKGLTANANRIRWTGENSTLQTDSFSVLPDLGPEDAMKAMQFQADYISAKGKSLALSGIEYGDSIHAQKMLIQGADIFVARDKRLPAKPGVLKPMPTKLISRIGIPLTLDTVQLQHGRVEVRETSLFTGREGAIPFDSLQAQIIGLTTHAKENDSLRIIATASVMGNLIDDFHYSESYADSLSAFRLHFHASPMELTNFSKAIRPLASIELNRGRSDTLYADWIGNKYAAIGKMHFVYRGLSLKVLDRRNFEREGPLLSVISFLANSFLRSKNNKQSIVYYERNQEKFIFNYWVKSSFSGLMSGIGIKRNRRMVKHFRQNRKNFHLPDVRNLERKHLLRSR